MKYLPTIDTHKLTCTLMGTCLLLSSSCSVDPSPSESDMADAEMSRSTQEYNILPMDLAKNEPMIQITLFSEQNFNPNIR